MLQSRGQRASASVHETSSALPPKYTTSGAGAVSAARSQPRRRVPSTEAISIDCVPEGRCAVEARGCGK